MVNVCPLSCVAETLYRIVQSSVFFPNGRFVTSASMFVARSFLFAQGNKFLGDPGSIAFVYCSE